MPMSCSLSVILALQLVLLLLLLPPQQEASPVPTNRHLVHIDKGRYTLTRPLLAKRRTGTHQLATPPTPVTGQLLDSDAESASPRSPQDSPSIIVVPKWRVSSGCRIYQRTDPRGRCRDRW